MGREIRQVPENWEHPKNEYGRLKPLLPNFSKCLEDWNISKEKWDKGYRESHDSEGKWQPREERELDMSFEEWYGKKPVESDYMPEWENLRKNAYSNVRKHH